VDRARLAALALFADLPDEELDAVARVAEEVRFDGAGQPVTTEGEFGHTLYVIESGSAEVSVDGDPVGAVQPGDVIGEIAVLRSGRRTASVVTSSPVVALAFFKRDVWALERSAPLAAQRLRDAAERRSETESVAP
jgi:CRP-like cAMP-binding protein